MPRFIPQAMIIDARYTFDTELMTRIIAPTMSFRLFDAVVTKRVAPPFSSTRLFAEFSSLVETLLLADEVLFFNVGAFNFEWEDGSIFPTRQPVENPFAPFHGVDFIQPAPIENYDRPPIIESVPSEERERIFNLEFGEETRHEFSLWIYLITYEQAYNGWFGDVTVKEYPLIQNVLGEVFRFTGSSVPVRRDPLMLQAHERLRQVYAEQLKGIEQLPLSPFIIPPLTATLLARLPDSVQDPYVVVQEVLGLRDELQGVRQRFRRFEEALYSDEATIEDWRAAHAAVEAYAKALEKKFGQPFHDRASVRWFIDNLSFLAKLLIKRDIEPHELAGVVGKLIPRFADRLSARVPSLLFDLAMKTKNIRGYNTLVKRKLGLELT